MSLEIRFAQRQDSETLFTFIQELASFEKMEDQVLGDVKDLEKSHFDNKECEAILAFVEGKAVGFALFFSNYSTFLTRKGLYLEDLYVSPKARGHGVGKALLSYLASLAEERNCGRFEWTVLDWNEKAIQFYDSLGAKPLKDWLIYRLEGKELQELASENNKAAA